MTTVYIFTTSLESCVFRCFSKQLNCIALQVDVNVQTFCSLMRQSKCICL